MLNVSSINGRPRREKRVDNLGILPRVVGGVIRNALADSGRVRRDLLKNLWIELKRFGAAGVRNVELSRIRGIQGIQVEGPAARHEPLVLSALSQVLECERIFEIGTHLGETTWLLAHNLPSAQIYTLNLPRPEASQRGQHADESYLATWERRTPLRDTPERSGITQLYASSATFDYSPYRGSIDLVYIDVSESDEYVRPATEGALGMLSDLGSIVWGDYTDYPGTYDYLNDLARSLDRPIYHILETRLALYSRWEVIVPAG